MGARRTLGERQLWLLEGRRQVELQNAQVGGRRGRVEGAAPRCVLMKGRAEWVCFGRLDLSQRVGANNARPNLCEAGMCCARATPPQRAMRCLPAGPSLSRLNADFVSVRGDERATSCELREGHWAGQGAGSRGRLCRLCRLCRVCRLCRRLV